MPLRLQLGNAAGAGFVNARLGSDPLFFPDVFCAGTAHAIPRVFSALSGWRGDSPHRAPLSAMLTATLLDRFAASHRALADAGFRIDFTWPSTSRRIDSDSDNSEDIVKVSPVRTWITFGPAELATSTLLRGSVDVRWHNVVFERRCTGVSSQQPVKIFREVCFEYVYRPSRTAYSAAADNDDDDVDDAGSSRRGDEDEDTPDFNWKRRMMLQGQRIGIDAVVDCSEPLEYIISKISNGHVVMKGSVDLDRFAVRMESSHFIDDFDEDGAWKLADIDLCLTHPRVLEEEADL
ncbi:hypothetical protein HDU83_004783 [Entophlyctis luteolus]|nr:hypothetical protein HDU83_004783 [Entophlyctis luteolus]